MTKDYTGVLSVELWTKHFNTILVLPVFICDMFLLIP